MYSRMFSPPQGKSYFLFGPRGTGKSSWVRFTYPEAVYLDLLESELYNDLLANPQRLESMIPARHAGWIILDGIQRIPEVLQEVHRLIEKRGYRFILTGSSARKLRRKGINLLAGRALTCRLYPLTVAELENDFDLRHSLVFGHLPCAYTEKDPKAYLESYVHTYLREEVQQEGITRNLSAFSRFLESSSFSQASVLNISDIARDARVERKTVENYFEVLEDLLLASRLPVFSKRARRKVVSHPKFFFFDAGVFRVLRPMGPLDSPEEAEGPALETLFLQELKAVNDYLNCGYQIYYWKTADGSEVDFVLYGNKGIKAFEIKRSARYSRSMLKGLKSFLREYPVARAFLVYGGRRTMHESDVEILPVTEALRLLPELLKR